jgi:hypothetical protein
MRSKPILANDGQRRVPHAAEIMEGSCPVPVEIALFDGEDQGRRKRDRYLLGSREGPRMTPRPAAVIILDIVGGKELHICREGYGEERAGWLNQILFGRAALLGLSGFDDRVCYTVLDDHVPFLRRGLPAVDLVDMHYPQWHTSKDVPEACSPSSLGQCGRLMADFVYGGALR